MASKARRGGAKNAVPKQRSRGQAPDAYDEYDDPAPRAAGHSLKKPSGKKKGSGKKKKRERSPLWAKLTLTFGALLMMVAGGAIVGVKTFVGKLEDSVQVVNVLDEAGKDTGPEGDALTGAIDLLLLGIDVRATQERNNARADTILLLHIPASHDQAYLMSIPRDSMVEIPANSKTRYNGGTDRINAAFYFGAQNGGGWEGGMALTAKTVTKLTGIQFDGAAVIDFGGFSKIINALGTVNICVESDSESLHYYHVNGKVTYVNEQKAHSQGLKAYVHKKGCREMQGWEALDYSRIRKSLDDGDYGRQRHQQQLIKAMAKKAASSGVLTDVNKITALTSAVGSSLILDTKGRPLIDFLFSLKDLASADLVLLKTNAGWFNSTGSGGEALNEGTMQMFNAAKTDTLGQFTLLNPEFVNNEK
ncbi:LCP family protein [Catellatospora sp. KI3]|uniref:LCP family protein n=1 Tax=Catellatospora sp. KI3 TaxID=3041620 RepID=UPI0024831112|nr:LCP family protein [Catellatospora sp. KI3]MDI1461741.1 LCP family protein [Catellatospora sp. KI3]